MFEDFGNEMDEVNQIAAAMLEDSDASRVALPGDRVFRVWMMVDDLDAHTRERFVPMLEEAGWGVYVQKSGELYTKRAFFYCVLYSLEAMDGLVSKKTLIGAVEAMLPEMGIDTYDSDVEDFFDFDEYDEVVEDEVNGWELWRLCDDRPEKRSEMLLEYLVYDLHRLGQ